MARRLALILSFALTVPAFAYAQDTHSHHDNHGAHHAGSAAAVDHNEDIAQALAEDGRLVEVNVLGMVCDFCAVALTKTFGRRDDVAAVQVNLDTKRLRLVLKQGQAMDDGTITQLVEQAGYKVQTIVRADEA